MARTIDELLIGIGLDVDQKEFNAINSSFDSIKSSAMQMGAAVMGAVSFNELTFGFSEMNDKLGKFADFMQVSPGFIYDFGRAIEHNGGAAEDATKSIERLAQIQDSLVTGEGIGWMKDVAVASEGLFDPTVIRRGQTYEDMLTAISGQMAKLNAEQRRRVGRAFGFDLGVTQTIQSPEFLKDQLEWVRKFGTVSNDMTKTAANFNDATQDLRDAALDLRNSISDQMLPELTKLVNDATGFYADNKGEIQNGIETLSPYLEDTIKLLGLILLAQGGGKLAGMAIKGGMALASPITATIAVTGEALMAEYEKKQRGEFNLFDELKQRYESAGQSWDDLFKPQKMDATPLTDVEMNSLWSGDVPPSTELIKKAEAYKLQNTVPGSGYASELTSKQIQEIKRTTNNTNNVTININGGDTSRVEEVVKRVISGQATQATQDLRVEAQ